MSCVLLKAMIDKDATDVAEVSVVPRKKAAVRGESCTMVGAHVNTAYFFVFKNLNNRRYR